MPFPYPERDWSNVPDGTTPPPGAPVADEAWFEAVEDALREHDGHQAAIYAVHGGLVWYVAASSVPPVAPPTGLPWRRTDTKEAVWNSGTPGAPVWEPLAEDPYKLTAADFFTDYVVFGLLPPVPSNSMTVQIPVGAAYVIGKRVAKALEARTVLSGKSTLVDLSSGGVYANVDNGILLDDCEDTWNEKTDADFVQSIVAGPSGGGNAVRFAIAAGAAAGDSVSEAIPSTDISGYGKLRVRIRSSVIVAAGDLQILLDDTASVASPVHTLNVPALVANTWTTVDIAYTPGVGSAAIISLGLKYAVDIGAANVDIADVWAVKSPEPAVTANSIRLFEARADRDIAQKELVDIVAANSTLYTIRINGIDVTYTSDASVAEGEIALGLVAAINASVNVNVTPVTAATTALATDAAATFTITADVAGVPFTILGDTRLTVTEVTPSSTASVVEIVDRRVLAPTPLVTFPAAAHGFWSSTHSDVDATDTPANGDTPVFDSTSGKWKAQATTGGGSAAPVPVISILSLPSAFGWTNMPAALTEFLGSGSVATRMRSDLTNATQARVVVMKGNAAGATNAELRAQYSTDGGTNWNYMDVADGPKVNIAPASSICVGAWVTLAVGAKADVLLRIVGINGDAVADPNFSSVQLQVK